ncbi:MAG: hypothetical protein WC307_03905 [Candidatus Nanoarchaeia archaeon]|jgi:hypothetical protein
MNKALIILSLLCLVLTPVIGATTDLELAGLSQDIKDFFNAFDKELASMAIAAIATMGLRAALRKYQQFEESSLNAIIVVLFISIFIVTYSLEAYVIFSSFIGILIIAGIGAIIWGTYKGMEESGFKFMGKITGAVGFFLMAWFAWVFNLDWLAIIFAILGVIMIFVSFKGENFDLFKGKNDKKTIKSIDDEVEGDLPEYNLIKNDAEYESMREESRELLTRLETDLTLANKELSSALNKLKGGLQ